MPNTLPEPDDSRALVGGGGFLYLRLGGVEPGVRNWYGPWFVKEGGSFETAEIPAGDYRFMAILYSAERIEHRRFIASGTELSVAEALSLPDDDFMDALGIQRNEPGEPEDPVVQANGNAFSWAVRGSASGQLVKNVRVLSGRRNRVQARLDPITPYEYDLEMYAPGAELLLDLSFETYARRRVFIRLNNLNHHLSAFSPGTVLGLRTEITSEMTGLLRNGAMYRSDSRRLQGFSSAGPIKAPSLQ